MNRAEFDDEPNRAAEDRAARLGQVRPWKTAARRQRRHARSRTSPPVRDAVDRGLVRQIEAIS